VRALTSDTNAILEPSGETLAERSMEDELVSRLDRAVGRELVKLGVASKERSPPARPAGKPGRAVLSPERSKCGSHGRPAGTSHRSARPASTSEGYLASACEKAGSMQASSYGSPRSAQRVHATVAISPFLPVRAKAMRARTRRAGR